MEGSDPLTVASALAQPNPLGARGWLRLMARLRAMRQSVESRPYRPILDDSERAKVLEQLAALGDEVLDRALAEPEGQAEVELPVLEAAELRTELAALLTDWVEDARFKANKTGGLSRFRPTKPRADGMLVASPLVAKTSTEREPEPEPLLDFGAVEEVVEPKKVVLTSSASPPVPVVPVVTPAEDAALEQHPSPIVIKRRVPASKADEAKQKEEPATAGRLVGSARARRQRAAPVTPPPIPAEPVAPTAAAKRQEEESALPPFLRQKNILVGLALGALLLLGGSIKLAIEIWALDNPVFKFGTFVGGSLLVLGLGEAFLRWLRLNLAGRAVMGVFVLLVPLNLLAADALEVPLVFGLGLAAFLLAGCFHASHSLVGAGRVRLAACFGLVALCQLAVGPMTPSAGGLERMPSLGLLILGSLAATGGMLLYARHRGSLRETHPELTASLHEPILAGAILGLPFLLLALRVGVLAGPQLAPLLGPGLLVLAGVPLEVARLLRQERHEGLPSLIATVLAGFLAAVSLIVSVFDPQSALACGLLAVLLLGRALWQEPERDLLLGGLGVAVVVAYVAGVGLLAGTGAGFRRYLPAPGADAAILYLPLVCVFLAAGVGLHRLRQPARARVFRQVGQLGVVILLVVLLRGQASTGAYALAAALGLLVLFDGRFEHAAGALFLLGVALVAPANGLTERAIERAPLLSGLGLAMALVPFALATVWAKSRGEGRPPRALSALDRAGAGVGPGLALAALLAIVLGGLFQRPAPIGLKIVLTSGLAAATLIAATARLRAAWLAALIPVALGPGAAALGVGYDQPFNLIFSTGAVGAAVSMQSCAALLAVGAAVWAHLRRGCDDEALAAGLGAGAAFLGVVGICFATTLRGDPLALSLILLAVTGWSSAVACNQGFLVHGGSVAFCAATSVLTWTHFPGEGPGPGRIGSGVAAGTLLLAAAAWPLFRGTGGARRDFGHALLRSVEWQAVIVLFLGLIAAAFPGRGAATLLLVFASIAGAAFVRKTATRPPTNPDTIWDAVLARFALLGLLAGIASLALTRLGPVGDDNAIFLGLALGTAAGALLGEVRGGRPRYPASAWQVALAMGALAASAAAFLPSSLGVLAAPLAFAVTSFRAEARIGRDLRSKLAIATGLGASLAAARGVLLAFGVGWDLGTLETSLALLAAAAAPLALGFVLPHATRGGLAHVTRFAAAALTVNALASGGSEGAAVLAAGALVLGASFLVSGAAFDVVAGLLAVKLALILGVIGWVGDEPSSREQLRQVVEALALILPASTCALALLAGSRSLLVRTGVPPAPTWRGIPLSFRWKSAKRVIATFALLVGCVEIVLLVFDTTGAAVRVSNGGVGPLWTGSVGTLLLTLGLGALTIRHQSRGAFVAAFFAGVLAALRLSALLGPERWFPEIPGGLAVYALVVTLLGRHSVTGALGGWFRTWGRVTAVTALGLAIPSALFAPLHGPALWLASASVITLAVLDRVGWMAHVGIMGASLASYASAFRVLDVSAQNPERAIVGAGMAVVICFLLRTLAVHADEEQSRFRIRSSVYWTWAIVNSFVSFAAFGLFVTLFWPQRAVGPASWGVVASAGLLLSGAAALYVDMTRKLKQEVFVYLAELAIGSFFLFLWVARPDLFGHGFFRRYWPVIMVGSAYGITFLSVVLERAKSELFARPLRFSGLFLPLGPVVAGWLVETHVAGSALAMSAVLYATVASLRRSTLLWGVAGLLGNLAIWAFLASGEIPLVGRPELYLAPLSLTFVLVGKKLEATRPLEARVLREGGALLVFLSLSFALFVDQDARVYESIVLTALSIGGVLLGIQAGIRQFVFLGAGFLLLTVTTNVYWLSEDSAWVWWIYVVLMGLGLIVLFSFFEKIRDRLGGPEQGPPADI